jgi:hypothetical protein
MWKKAREACQNLRRYLRGSPGEIWQTHGVDDSLFQILFITGVYQEASAAMQV